jgi:hypothetical protein
MKLEVSVKEVSGYTTVRTNNNKFFVVKNNEKAYMTEEHFNELNKLDNEQFIKVSKMKINNYKNKELLEKLGFKFEVE